MRISDQVVKMWPRVSEICGIMVTIEGHSSQSNLFLLDVVAAGDERAEPTSSRAQGQILQFLAAPQPYALLGSASP
jgi:hypothetical protein